MKRLEKKQKKEKISGKELKKGKRGSECEQFPAFSLRYLTNNKKYNFYYFDDQTEKMQMSIILLERLHELSKQPYSSWIGMSKEHGCELINFWKCNFKPDELKITSDDKVWIFRFCNQKYRIIGVRLDSCPILYIIGFDFDYSAYSHGS